MFWGSPFHRETTTTAIGTSLPLFAAHGTCELTSLRHAPKCELVHTWANLERSPRRRCTRRSRSPCSMGRPSRRPTAIQAALRRKNSGRRLARAVLSVVEQPALLIGALNSPHE